MRVLLHTGKGGVGKTSLSVATALRAAELGRRVFLLSTDGAHSLGDALARPIGPTPVEVRENLVVQEVAPLAELERSWTAIRRWFMALLHGRDPESGGAGEFEDDLVAEELLVLPGLEELVSLRAVLDVERSGEFDVCLVDCAPTGSALRMLRLPDVLRLFMGRMFDMKRRAAKLMRPMARGVGAERLVPPDEVFAAFESLYEEIEAVRDLLLDSERTSARLVLQPNRVVVEETRRAYAYLNLYGIAVDAVLVNRVLPDEASGGYFARWAEREREERLEIERSFAVPRFEVPLYPQEPLGIDALAQVGREVFGAQDPSELLQRGQPIRLAKRGRETLLEIDLPHASAEDVDVTLHGDELLVRVRDALRPVALPDSLRGMSVASAKLVDGVLLVAFGASAPSPATARAAE